jgi:hypothetical protein
MTNMALRGQLLSVGFYVAGSVKVKVKVKLSLCFFLTEHDAMKAYWGSGGLAPRIL